MDLPPKADLFGVMLSLTDYGGACRAIMAAAKDRRSFAMSALATHGVIEAVQDRTLAAMLNRFELVVPDGQPVRWALNMLRNAGLPDRVAGPDLLWNVCAAAARERVGVYVYGSTPSVCARMVSRIRARQPEIRLSGIHPDRFRDATPEEDEDDVRRINSSGAGIVLVGRGCPRQERWVAAHKGSVHAAMLALGAAFDFAAASAARAPVWMQRGGLEWLHRLSQDPCRLAARYARTNSLFVALLAREMARGGLGLRRTAPNALSQP